MIDLEGQGLAPRDGEMSSVDRKHRSKHYSGKRRRQSIKKRLCHKNESLQLELRRALADKEAQQVVISDLKRSDQFY